LVVGLVAVIAAFGLGLTLNAALAQGPAQTPPPFAWGMMGGAGYEWMSAMRASRDGIIAKNLGLTVDELYAQLRAGKTIAQLAQEKNVDLTKVQTEIREAHKNLIEQYVKDGKLTRQQADWMLARINAMGNFTCPMFGGSPGPNTGYAPGYGRGRGMMGGWW
jgi:hypothetical protein